MRITLRTLAARTLVACSWMPFALAAAQQPAPTAQQPASGAEFIASRQAEINQVGHLVYRVHFDDGSWTHQQVSVCPAFTHFAFARYTRTPPTGENTSFLAVFALNNPPAHSIGKPWQGGILLLPEKGLRNRNSVPLVEQGETVKIFNRMWAEEMRISGQPGVFPTLTWPGLADCYARFGGREPSHIESDAPLATSIDVRTATVNKAMIPLEAPLPAHVSLVVEFDRHALLTSASLSTTIY